MADTELPPWEVLDGAFLPEENGGFYITNVAGNIIQFTDNGNFVIVIHGNISQLNVLGHRRHAIKNRSDHHPLTIHPADRAFTADSDGIHQIQGQGISNTGLTQCSDFYPQGIRHLAGRFSALTCARDKPETKQN